MSSTAKWQRSPWAKSKRWRPCSRFSARPPPRVRRTHERLVGRKSRVIETSHAELPQDIVYISNRWRKCCQHRQVTGAPPTARPSLRQAIAHDAQETELLMLAIALSDSTVTLLPRGSVLDVTNLFIKKGPLFMLKNASSASARGNRRHSGRQRQRPQELLEGLFGLRIPASGSNFQLGANISRFSPSARRMSGMGLSRRTASCCSCATASISGSFIDRRSQKPYCRGGWSSLARWNSSRTTLSRATASRRRTAHS